MSSLRYTDQSENVAELRTQTALDGVSSGFLAGSDIWRLLLCYCATVAIVLTPGVCYSPKVLIPGACYSLCRYVVRSVVFGQQY